MRGSRMVSAREIVGKRIVGFEPNPTDAGPQFGTVHEPVIVLDDGSRLLFMAEPTDDQYGVFIWRVR